MADASSMHSLSSTLGTQPMSSPPNGDPQQHAQHPHIANPADLNHHGMPLMGPPQPPQQPGVEGAPPGVPEQPVKRKPGRPKGSGKKPVDPNAPPKIKRPVGRPRKDGLPAGSVGPRRPSRPRKRPPGSFASGPQTSPTGTYPYATPFAVADPAWGSASAPPMAVRPGRPAVFPIDPSLHVDDWGEMSRTRPDRFLHALVQALEAPNPVSGAGPSVEEAFKSHLISLAPNSKNAAPSIPSLYSILKTFWLPSSPVYFSLTASASTARIPSEHRFVYWDPQPLVFNGIGCPVCALPLANRGRISSGPIKVYDLGKPFFVIGCEYVCTSPACMAQTGNQGRKYASTDATVLRALPIKLKDEFPALLLQGNPDLGSGPEIWNWQGMGVSTSLWNMVRASVRAGLRKEAILDIVRAIQVGVPDFDYTSMSFKHEEEEPDQGMDDEDDEQHDSQQVEGDLNADKDQSTEEFQDAWNANSGVPDGDGAGPSQMPEAGPSDSQEHHSPNGHHSASAGPPPPPQSQPPPSQPPPVAPPPQSQPQPHPPPHYAFAPPPPQAPYPAYPYPYPYPQWSQPPEPQAPATLKRTFSIVDGTPDPGLSEPLHKRVRHCCKCGSNECKGKGGRAFCNNPCQDCGKMECKGRNSKRPDRTCSDAWP
ncbi:uncharacterized protein BXZ73DRAFT_38176 [Epithele typhae]|uniref:uncharacterized protein n=1 Tax=Epithele typhae TaxID=378194 RepID=UPI0020072A6E|nr:uncharacterized protein BXZ73DRAFT_38176 [Epithele typhae]KAH9945438.1 hypothetical protein BXZ73DRAFT_38176 [Epithele typhae]